MSKVWFTSDLHLGHKFVAGLRGFDDPAEMDAVLIDNINSVVGEHDTLWILGDVAMGDRAEGLAKLDAIKAEKHLITGNHDTCWPGLKKANVAQKMYAAHFASIQPFARLGVNSVGLVLSHFPYNGDSRGEDRYSQWRLKDAGLPLVHGHTHGTERGSLSSLGTPQVHVGLEAWDLMPVEAATVTKLVRSLQRNG